MENQSGWSGFDPASGNVYSSGSSYPPDPIYPPSSYPQEVPSSVPSERQSVSPVALGVIVGLLIVLLALGGFLIYRLTADDHSETAENTAAETQQEESQSTDNSSSSEYDSDKQDEDASSGDSEVWAENEERSTPWPPAGATEVCTSSIAVNEVTTCGFAANVESAYRRLGPNGGTVRGAYSPTTNLDYTMVCTNESSTLAVCRGGVNATVYIRR